MPEDITPDTSASQGSPCMDVIEAIHTRRSVRSYSPRPVERELIEHVIWDAAQAPPPRSGQVPWTFNVIEGAECISAYGDQAKRYARDNHPDEPGWDWSERPECGVFWGAPAFDHDIRPGRGLL